jgi:hypothetical protein
MLSDSTPRAPGVRDGHNAPSTYRKLKPGAVEFLFYDHPSGYERVHRAMIWLKENMAATPAASASR